MPASNNRWEQKTQRKSSNKLGNVLHFTGRGEQKIYSVAENVIFAVDLWCFNKNLWETFRVYFYINTATHTALHLAAWKILLFPITLLHWHIYAKYTYSHHFLAEQNTVRVNRVYILPITYTVYGKIKQAKGIHIMCANFMTYTYMKPQKDLENGF